MSWSLITIVALAVGFLLSRLVRKTIRVAISCALTALALAVVVGTVICWDAPDAAADADPDYAVLLGCALEDGAPTEEMIRRMELALDWMQEDDHTVLILSGGDPQELEVSEAQVMYDWLQAKGADMSRIRIEDRAKDTRENLLYSRELAEREGLETDTVLLLTSEYHQTRAQYLAKELGQTAMGRSCDTPFLPHLEAAVREVYAFVKAYFETL